MDINLFPLKVAKLNSQRLGSELTFLDSGFWILLGLVSGVEGKGEGD